MEPAKPQNPSRPSRQPKESTALLMSVIRNISASETNEHRDKEKAKLEREFEKSDKRVDELIATHNEDLSAVIQAFGKVSTRLITSREKIKLIKENLMSCKKLLNCRREDIKKLWLEGIEHKHTLMLLEEIESLKGVPEKVEKYSHKKHFLHATELLVSSRKKMEGDLEGVDALKEVRHEMQIKQQALQSELLEELHRHLYLRSTSEVCDFYRQGLNRGELSPLHREGSDYSNVHTPTKRREASSTPGRQNQLELALFAPAYKYRQYNRMSFSATSPLPLLSTVDGRLSEDLLADPEEDSSHFLAILVECLALLNEIPNTVEIIKSRMQRELVGIIKRTSQLFADYGTFSQETSSRRHSQAHLLREFLELIFEQFRCVAQAHECVLGNLQRLANTSRNQNEIQFYEMADFWSRVQAVLRMLLGDYLDIENTTTTTQRPSSTFVESSADIASFFAKKRPTKSKKYSLFKFDASSHAISLNNYLKEQQHFFGSNDMLNVTGKAVEAGEKFFVCKPCSRNIMAIFIPLMNFIKEIEAATATPPGAQCTLHSFVTEFISEVIVGQVHNDAFAVFEVATKGNEAWKASSVVEVQKALNINRPLLTGTLQVEQCLQELRDTMQDLPLHAPSFLNMMCNFLATYKDCCLAAYRGIVQSDTEDRRVISAMWAKDEDINRFLRTFPNWQNLQNLKGQTAIAVDIEESPEEVRLRNQKESEMLTRNLADGTIPAHEIMSEVSQMRTLALMQESLEWFGGRIHKLASSLMAQTHLGTSSPTQQDIVAMPPISKENFEPFKQLAREFEDIAETCLLVLHLEVRVHCFYYLLPVAKQSAFASGVDSQDPDPEVVKLNKDFSSIDEALSSSLQPRKFKYIFEGLGHLVASIIINSAQYIKRINENGIKKMCRNIFAIQQNLTNITLSREVTLDHARHYFEMLYNTPEEILNQVVEHGPKFLELDYINALQLLHRSHPGSNPHELKAQIKRLHDILNEVAITI